MDGQRKPQQPSVHTRHREIQARERFYGLCCEWRPWQQLGFTHLAEQFVVQGYEWFAWVHGWQEEGTREEQQQVEHQLGDRPLG
jgi:hypothetical protein